MKEFKVNKYITLKLLDNETIIYVDGEPFRQCKSLFLFNPHKKIEQLEIKSIDEAAEMLDISLEPIDNQISKLPPYVEFWGHCSNLQAWNESGYDTRLIHSNLAFPLLKKLYDKGDPIAKKIFKEEISKRILEGNITVIMYLFLEHYIDYFNDEELKSVIINSKIFEKISHIVIENHYKKEVVFEFIIDLLFLLKERNILQELILNKEISIVNNLIKYISTDLEGHLADFVLNFLKNLSESEELINKKIRKDLFKIFSSSSINLLYELLQDELYVYLNNEDFEYLLKSSDSNFSKNLRLLSQKILDKHDIKIITQFYNYVKKISNNISIINNIDEILKI